MTLANADALIYQPQIDSWLGNALSWRVAVALRPSGTKDETFGVLWGKARTEVDRTTRTVELEDISVTKVNFPTLPGNGAAYLPGLTDALKGALATMALDSLETSLAASQTVKPGGLPVQERPAADHRQLRPSPADPDHRRSRAGGRSRTPAWSA